MPKKNTTGGAQIIEFFLPALSRWVPLAEKACFLYIDGT
jgi:hypothetical protein